MSPRDIERAEEHVLEATAQMCFHCFDVLVKELVHGGAHHKRKHPETPDFLKELPKTAQTPLFVTWDKYKFSAQSQYVLRGCIGTLSPKPLITAIGEYSLMAALQDRRFKPVESHELPHLRVGVSLLVKYEDCDHVHDWEVGVHGIIIKFTDDDNVMYSATYLPEVAKEQGWTQESTVESLIRKAGYNGPIHDILLRRIRCTRYQSSKHRVSYQDYIDCVGGPDAVFLPESRKRWCFSL